MTDVAPALPSPPTSATGSTDDLFASLDLPPARPTVVHQTIFLPFEGLNRDLKLNVDAGPGCGGVVWIAGEVLSRYCLHLMTIDKDKFAGKTILELGAGTGVVSLVLGIQEPRAKIWTTDQAVLLPLLKENVALNGLAPRVVPAVLSWGEPISEEIPCPPDFVLLADCVYFEPAFPLLVQTLLALTATEKQPEILLAYKKRRKADKRFFSQLGKHFTYADVEDDPRKATYEREGLKLLRVERKATREPPMRKEKRAVRKEEGEGGTMTAEAVSTPPSSG